MAYLRQITLLGLLMISTNQLAVAGSASEGIMVDAPYVRAVPPGQPNSASFMTLHNTSEQAFTLIGASSSVAEVVELHTHTLDGGMMRMRKVEQISLPAGEVVKLQPGGLHIMLIGLKQKLVPDETVKITLRFEDGSDLKVEAPVRKLQMQMKMSGQQGHMH